MGLFDWLRGGKAAETDTMQRMLADCVVAGDVIAIANAAAALDGAGTVVFGTAIAKIANRAELRDATLAALRAMLPTLAHDQCLQIFEIVVRGGRAKRHAVAAEIATRLGALIEQASAAELIRACVGLRARTHRVGAVEPADVAALCESLEHRALDRLRALVPTLEGPQAHRVLDDIRHANLAISVTKRKAELAELHRERMQVAIAAVSNEPCDAALEAALDSGDPAASHVLADWLAERDHPRGELIALQLRAESDASLADQVTAHLAAHSTALLGELADHQTTDDDRRRPAFTWKRGFIDAARISNDESYSGSPCTARDLLVLLLNHASGRRLRELSIGINDNHDIGLDDLIAELVTHRPALQRLELGDFTHEQSEMSWYRVGDVGRLWQALPELRTLVVRGADIACGAIAHAKLERLELQSGGISSACARELATATLPSVRHLDIWYGDPNYGGDAELGDVIALLDRDFPALVHLGLMNTALSDAICTVLPITRLAARLVELDLSLGTVTADGARALIANKSAFPKLASLDVSKTYIDEAVVAQLRAAFPTVIADELRHDTGARYPSVGE